MRQSYTPMNMSRSTYEWLIQIYISRSIYDIWVTHSLIYTLLLNAWAIHIPLYMSRRIRVTQQYEWLIHVEVHVCAKTWAHKCNSMSICHSGTHFHTLLLIKLARILAHTCTHIYTTHSYTPLIHMDDSFIWKYKCVPKYEQNCMKMWARVTHSHEHVSQSDSFTCQCVCVFKYEHKLWKKNEVRVDV